MDYNGLINRGIFYGYPQCCIDAFIREHIKESHYGIWTGTGFIPCKQCAKSIKTLDDLVYFVDTKIIPNRLSKKPFVYSELQSSPILFHTFLDQRKMSPKIRQRNWINYWTANL